MVETKNKALVEQIMTREVVCTHPEDSLTQAVNILVKNGFSGLPVTDGQNKVVGMLSDFDLVVQTSSIHLPTLFKLLEDFDVYQKDKKFLGDNVRKILSLRVKDIMNPNFIAIESNTPIAEVMGIFAANSRANPLPIVTEEGKIAGIVTRHDLAKLIGSPYSISAEKKSERQIDRSIDGFLNRFGRRFVLVSKMRTNYWFALSLLFALLGFIVAFAIIIRINNR